MVMEWAEYQDTENQAEVLRQLVELGYDITQRTFYRHCKQGKCRRKPETNLFTRRLVKQYVEAAGLRRSGMPAGGDAGPDLALSVENQKLQNEKLRIDNETRAVKLKKITGQLIERDGVYLEIAARTVALDSAFAARIIETACPRLIAAVAGDQNKLPEFQDLLREEWETMMNSFCTTDTFEVLFDDEERLEGVDELIADNLDDE